ncbi:MAG: NUDIX domain-containing protein [Planctomycetes bacterium]|nr:NUDIX domain-containing protein [Planctomycetota bacterium]
MQDQPQQPPGDPRKRRPRRPAFTVRAAIERDHQILFMRARDESSSSPDRCWYFLPGGHVDHGETLEQALRREIREEIGIELDHLRPAFLREFIAPLHQRLSPEMPPDHHVIALIYRCRPVPGATPRFEKGVDGTSVVDDLLWIDRDQLETLDIRPPHLRQGLSIPETDPQPLTLWPEQ